ncbi:MAG TPA: 2-C-methyl-D-erythritol 4-phosphate cytidylyltransferase, partial [Oceanipulchritudo sp.]|nr:2-C-methyl-D-erythritol 4-phosphate cytidylyltransferase [Oceanipulchritudo sp.]
MQHVAILLAGGSGSRMSGSVEDKVLVEIGGKPVFAHVLEAFSASGTQQAFIVVARDDQQRKELTEVIRKAQIQLPVFYTIGGKERQDSVKAGLAMVPTESKWVTIHDCARPAVSTASLQAVHKTMLALDCAVSLAHRVTDTIRHFDQSPVERPARGRLLNRDYLWAMETP